MLATSGKTLRRSFDRTAGRAPLHVVTAFGAGAGIVTGQRAVAEGGNGITAARALPETRCLDAVPVTADALHTQSGTASLILERGGDYLFALKDNHPLLRREVAECFASPPGKLAQFPTVDADPGRIGARVHRASHEVNRLFLDRRCTYRPRLPGLAMTACVQSRCLIGESTATARRFHVSPARLTSEAVAKAAGTVG